MRAGLRFHRQVQHDLTAAAVNFLRGYLGVSQVRQHRKSEGIIERQKLVRCLQVAAHVVDHDGGAQQTGHFPQMDLDNALPALRDIEVGHSPSVSEAFAAEAPIPVCPCPTLAARRDSTAW